MRRRFSVDEQRDVMLLRSGKFTRNGVLRLLKSTADLLASERDIKCRVGFDDSKSSSIATIMDTDLLKGESVVSVRIGSGDLPKNKSSVVSDFVLVESLLALGHEFGHADQAIAMHADKCNDPLFVLTRVSNINNTTHYMSHYKQNILELDAEKRGLIIGYDSLCSIFPEDYSEALILACVNDKKGTLNHSFDKNAYFIVSDPEQNYTSLDDVIADYDKSIENLMFCGGHVYGEKELKGGFDEFQRVFHTGLRESDMNSKWYDSAQVFQSSNNIMDSYKMMATVSCFLHPEYFEQVPMLKDLDLIPECTFGMSFPESREEVAAHLGMDLKKGDYYYEHIQLFEPAKSMAKRVKQNEAERKENLYPKLAHDSPTVMSVMPVEKRKFEYVAWQSKEEPKGDDFEF